MLKRLLPGFIFYILTNATFAATDPIQWSLNSTFPSTTRQGVTYTITYTFTNKLPFTLVHPIVITKQTNTTEITASSDTCTGAHLNPNQVCTVTLQLIPTSPGKKIVTVIIEGYDKNQVPLPTLTTTTSTNPPVTIEFVPPTTHLPPTMNVGDSAAPWLYTIKNNGLVAATGITITTNQPAFATTCTNQTPPHPLNTLAPNEECTVSGTFSPTSPTPAIQVITATITYTESVTPVTGNTISTHVRNLTGITVSAPEFPSIVLYGESYPITFTFTNHDASSANVTNANVAGTDFVFAASPTNPCPVTTGSLAAHSSCTYTGTLTPASPTTSYSVTSSLTYLTPTGGPTTANRTTTAQAAGAGARTFTFTNQCNFTVWFSFVGGAITNSPTCTTNAQCPIGTSCNPSSKLCYWNNYGPTGSDSFKLLAGSGPVSVTIPVPPTTPTPSTQTYAPGVLWSGVTSASLNCDDSSSCLQAECSNAGGTTSCAPGVGFSQPATQAEFTLLKSAFDGYDIEVINGFHIPIKMAPNPVTTGVSPYICGTPGNEVMANQFGACNWNNASPPTPTSSYYWVTTGGLPCPSNTCASGDLCGLDIGINQVCGKFLGYWSANNACAVNSANAQPLFGCTNYLSNPPYPSTTFQYSQLYGCMTPDASQPTLNSCYSDSVTPTDQCCGCANWQDIAGITLPATGQFGTIPCVNTGNTDWIPTVQNTLQWIKQACPNYYTYPYDDASASFSCNNSPNGGINSTGYDITFCAGGTGSGSSFTGLPAGATDGRCTTSPCTP